MSIEMERMKSEIEVLTLAVRVVSDALDALVEASMTADGSPAAPTAKDIAKARSMLPPRCKNAFRKA